MDVPDWFQPSHFAQLALGRLNSLAPLPALENATLERAFIFATPDNQHAPQQVPQTNPGSSGITLLWSLLPAGIALLCIVHDVLCSQTMQHLYPKGLVRFFRKLKSPFTDFLSLDDLADEPGPVVTPPLWKARLLVALAVVQAWVWAALAVYRSLVAGGNWLPSIGPALGALLGWTYVALRTVTKPPISPPYLSMLLYVASICLPLEDVCAMYLAYRAHEDANVPLTLLPTVIPLVSLYVAGTLPMKPQLPSPNVATDKDVPSNDLTVPEDSVTLWSWMTCSFVEPIFGVSMKRTLNETDVWSLSPYFTHKNLFLKYLEYQKAHPTHSLLRFLLVSNSLDLILDLVLQTWGAIVGFVPPYSLQRILAALADSTPGARRAAYIWAFVFFLANLSFAQVDVFRRWHTRRCYERTRGQLFCALHYKALVRKDVSGKTVVVEEGDTGKGKGKDENKEESGADLGKIVNLMQGDAYTVAQRFWDFAGVFLSPLRLIIALTFLYKVIGWSAFAGVIVVLVAYILNYPLAKYNIYITRQSWGARDRRMNLVNELFQNIRFLKFYGWESRWTHRVRDSRENELRWRVKENMVSTAIVFIWTWIPSATALATFLCYTLIAKQQLTVAKAFTSIALFSQLQGPMTQLPDQVFALLHAYVSMQRIESFLREPEVPDWASSIKSSGQPKMSAEKVGFDNASFEWDGAQKEEQARFILGPLNVSFPEGKLTLVMGSTGSGKSALFNALLGEMRCASGQVLLDKSAHQVAYCAQNPWLEHATVRDNIIFGSSFGYDEQRYNSVIEACALIKDLEILDAGDMTEIGEKGITLSGGQRARIALARALYSQASVILLDDPLAAVDMHTAQHLVKHALSGPLSKDRTIILVTHHVTLCLPVATYLLEIAAGRAIRQGTVEELQEKGLLQKIIETEDAPVIDGKDEMPTPVVENEADRVGDDGANKRCRTDGKLVEVEARAEGRVSTRSYMTYIRAAGIISSFLTFFFLIELRLINISVQFYMARWGEAYEQDETSIASLRFRWPWETLPSPNQNVVPWLLIYFYISMAGAFSVLAFIGIGYYASLQASRTLFNAMLTSLTGAPTRFFDITPIGRILNRWTADIGTVDGALQNSFRAALSGTLNFAASFVVIVCVVPSFAPCAVFIAWLYVRLAPQYIRTSRDLRRLESVSLSPAFAGFDELLRGLPHVRAFGMELRYQGMFYKKVDKFQSFDHVYWIVANWLYWRYDCLGSVVVFLTTVFALWSNIGDGLAALVIIQAEIFAEASRQLVRVLSQVELDFNSVERIVEYLDVPQEAPAIVEEKRPPAYWPSSSGDLVVRDLEVRYAPDLPSVLHRISFTVRPAEKIGVVGRTGSGKSTLALSLLRIVEPSGGEIIIDGINILSIGLDDLRTRVTIVSQDVSLFTGTIRSNLDPFEEHTDEECLSVLERCHLNSIFASSNGTSTPNVTLETPISQTGSLSAGERQLVALARAVLRRSNVIIMDEATSQIDTELDDQIQRTIRDEFAGAIVITIAHRLKTVLDYDRILVLGGGEILEFDTPDKLVEKQGGVFREMCRASADWHSLYASVVERQASQATGS